MLYLIATPIGNLEDITYRAINTLHSCDYILCEDTRKSIVLLNHYHIKKPLYSYHQHNEKKVFSKVIEDLKNNKNIALISDAGTPLISDPGFVLISECIKSNVFFTAIPGPSSILQALLLSGYFSKKFQFIGFLSKKEKELENTLKKALFYDGVTISFESPKRIIKTLQVLQTISQICEVAVCREMTKKFEECIRGTPENVLIHFEKTPPRGEITLIISPLKEPPKETLSSEELIDLLQKHHGLSLRDAIKMAAKLTKTPKNLFYKQFNKKKES